MIINDIFKSKKEELLNGIENLPVHNCIHNFVKYLNEKPEDDFERKYISILWDDLESIARTIIAKHYKDLSKEDLLAKLVQANIDAPYAFSSYEDNNEIDEFFDNYGYNDADAHSIIKEYMITQYTLLVEKSEATAKEERKNAILKSIATAEDTIERYQKNLVEYRNELVQLDKE